MLTAAQTQAGEALRAMLPAGADPDAMIEHASHLVLLVHDRVLQEDLHALVASEPDRAVGLIITLAALVDVDSGPARRLSWLGSTEALTADSLRTAGAFIEARKEYDEAGGDTLPPVTLESMRLLAHAARVAGVAQPCGTIGGWGRHVRMDKKVCARCRTARRLYDNASPAERKLVTTPLAGPAPKPPGRMPKAAPSASAIAPPPASADEPGQRRGSTGRAKKNQYNPPVLRRSCGKRSGYIQHRRHHEKPCEPCSAAQAAYSAQKYDELLARQGKTRVGRGVTRTPGNGLPPEVVKVPSTVGQQQVTPLPLPAPTRRLALPAA